MSREIKFRAWDIEAEEMRDWDYILNNLVGNYEDVFNDKRFIMMQFTGLKDRNGVDIYESDVVKGDFPYADTAVVVWDSKRCGLFLKPLNSTGRAVSDKYYKMNSVKLELVTNIHENPELLT